MKILHVSANDLAGGAARATFRLHRALRAADHESTMLVRNRRSEEAGVVSSLGRAGRKVAHWRALAGNWYADRLHDPTNPGSRSANVLPSPGLRHAINASDADVVNLHWVAGETMSIEDIGRIRKPVVWTLHDMWPFCGAEHYAWDEPEARWRTGYTDANRPAGATGPEIDRFVWDRKRRAWTRPMHVLCPSTWLAGCVADSALMRGWPVTAIPNVLDTDSFRPYDRAAARAEFGLPQDAALVLFGAWSGIADRKKGFDLLVEAMCALYAHYRGSRPLACVVLGASSGEAPWPIPTHWAGHVSSDERLAKLYSAADVTAVPSRIDNLPQLASEALSCGCPVAAFRTSGLPDLVIDRECGVLAPPFDTAALADGIEWLIADPARRQELSRTARERAVRLWHASSVLPRYLSWYQTAIDAGCSRPGRRRPAGAGTSKEAHHGRQPPHRENGQVLDSVRFQGACDDRT